MFDCEQPVYGSVAIVSDNLYATGCDGKLHVVDVAGAAGNPI